jgi:hypothetical protein
MEGVEKGAAVTGEQGASHVFLHSQSGYANITQIVIEWKEVVEHLPVFAKRTLKSGVWGRSNGTLL